jgi:hypothetical protein
LRFFLRSAITHFALLCFSSSAPSFQFWHITHHRTLVDQETACYFMQGAMLNVHHGWQLGMMFAKQRLWTAFDGI